MGLDYIRKPSPYVQQELFSSEDFSYFSLDYPLFFGTLIKWQFNENLFYLVSEDFSYLIVSGYGVKLSKKSERLIIKDSNKAIYELPFFRLQTVAIMSRGVGLSSDLIEEFSKAGVNLSFHEFSGKPYALLQGMSAPQKVELKKIQINAQKSVVGLSFAASVVCGKISNQSSLLKYAVKNLKPDTELNLLKIQTVKNTCAIMQKILHDLETDVTLQQIMGYEGTSARLYWQAVGQILSEKIEFGARLNKGKIPRDCVNPLLNYGYGILYAKIWSAITLAGLDAYIGFLHSDQQGKPSLVFDLIEEFRAPIVDRTVIAYIMLNRNITITNGLIDLETRRKFSEKIIDRLSSAEYYEGQKIMISDIILSQARKIVGFLEGRYKQYDPFIFKW
ncbi:MAG: CRISPR-associated endonuclease Cas1 [Endomicrobium sp.]|jgi:CRISPR-associated protein Cas1|nr:CRISPR-associated endonuclease Cas1 [Endomicrobium sp.]